VIDLGEDCDGVLFGVIDECVDYVEFSFGSLVCASTCLLVTGG